MWTEGNYRRIFLDMHIDDSDEVYLSKTDPEAIFRQLQAAGAQEIAVKCRTHTGLAHYPTKIGRMHRGLAKRGLDYTGEMVRLCRENGIAVMGYFSQIYDNWAYDNHPDWRCVDIAGRTTRELPGRSGRYGLVCPNNMDYRAYVKDCLTEIMTRYRFDSMFLDMPFFLRVCYCPACKARYFRETGRELPRVVDWDDPAFVDFQRRREGWMSEFTAFAISCVKAVQPDCTVEENIGGGPAMGWVRAMTDDIADQCEYVGGDLYGGYLQESFICKYFRNQSNTLPFNYHTSRCEPNLNYHTSTRTAEEFTLYGIIALVHNGAFTICDAVNPDGTICASSYLPIKKAFTTLARYDRIVNGDYAADLTIFLPSYGKHCRAENGKPIAEVKSSGMHEFIDNAVRVASLLRAAHIPYDVLPSKKLAEVRTEGLVLSCVEYLRESEMAAVEDYIRRGGNVYLSGRPGHPRLLELLEAEYMGDTEEDVTYMSPTEAGAPYFESFSADAPLALCTRQAKLRFRGEYEVLATLTLPYVRPGGREFASIHSDPPGIPTDIPAVVRKRVGRGSILFAAGPVESAQPYMSRLAMTRLLRSLFGELSFEAVAPPFVETMRWEKDGKLYFAALNEQETAPITPMGGIRIRTREPIRRAVALDTGTPVEVRPAGGGSELLLPEVGVFLIVEAERA